MTGSERRACPSCGTRLRSVALFCPQCGTDVMPAVSNTLQLAMQTFFAQIKPNQAEVLRRCAIPRWFDAELLGVLRDREGDSAQNAALLAQIAKHSFVRDLGEGRYAYNEDVRSLLLDEWWRKRRPELEPVLRRLHGYFLRRMSKTSLHNQAMWLRELVTYNLLLASLSADASGEPIERSLKQLRVHFDQAVSGHRLAEAEALLVSAEEQRNILAPPILDWLTFYRARLAHANLQFTAAIDCYRELKQRGATLAAELRVAVYNALGAVYVETGAWSAAIRTYREALALPGLSAAQEAEARLGLADAYSEVAISSGGWYIAPVVRNRALRAARQGFTALSLLAVFVLVSILRRRGAAVPPPLILLRYQNWLLARIFRAAREEIEAAEAYYQQTGDEHHLGRCAMRLVESDIVFGKTHDALARAQRLLAAADSSNAYRYAKIRHAYAKALQANGRYDKAEAEARAALQVFRELGDARWTTRTLTTLGRLATARGEADAALAAYQEGLEQARQAGSVLGRERILYELRVWRRLDTGVPLAVDSLLQHEPEQRFVARLPGFVLPYIQAGQMIFFPGMLLLAAVLVPRLQAPTILSLRDNILIPAPAGLNFPWERIIIAILVVLVLAGLAYTILGLLILWRMPLARLQDNQPEVVEITPTSLAVVNAAGERQGPLAWADIAAIISANRKLWKRPMPAFSRTFAEGQDGRRLKIEGIISWYSSVRWQIENRARQAGAAYREERHDLTLLRSLSGLLVAVGFALLGWLIFAGNGWLPDPARFLEPSVYAVVQIIGYSGVLMIIPMIYWIVIRPLQLGRELGANDRLPILFGAAGFALLLLFVVFGDLIVVPSFAMSLFLAGVFLLSETFYQVYGRGQRRLLLRLGAMALQALILFASITIIRAPLLADFHRARAVAYSIQGDSVAAANERLKESQYAGTLFDPALPLEQAALDSLSQDWSSAAAGYEALLESDQDTLTRGLAYHNLAAAQLQSCLGGERGCPDPRIIIANEDEALKLLSDPEARSAAYETQAEAYLLLGDDDDDEETAALLFEQAANSTQNPERRAMLARKIAELDD